MGSRLWEGSEGEGLKRNGEGEVLNSLESPTSFPNWARGPKMNCPKARPKRNPISKSRVKSRTPDILLILLLIKGRAI